MAKTKKQHSEAEQLEKALGLSFRDVEIEGETVTVRKFKLKAMAPVYDVLAELSTATQEVGMNAGKMITAFPNLAAKLIAHATDRPETWAEDLEIEDAADLLAATMEVNSRFFTGEAMAKLFECIQVALVPSSATTAISLPDSLPS